MDVHLHNSRPLHFGMNERIEDDLQFLSQEERDCIQFFEDTIGALEEDDDERPASFTSAPVDHDIIDLVHTHPPATKTQMEVKVNNERLPVILPTSDREPQKTGPTPPTLFKNTNKTTEHQSVPPEHQSSLESPLGPKHGLLTHVTTERQSIPSEHPSSLEFPHQPNHRPPTHVTTERQSIPSQHPSSLEFPHQPKHGPPTHVTTERQSIPPERQSSLEFPHQPKQGQPTHVTTERQSIPPERQSIPPESQSIPPERQSIPPESQSIPPERQSSLEFPHQPKQGPPTHVTTEHQSIPQERRSSLELPHQPKHGPPTHAKPMRLPDNISLLLGSREHLPHSIATEAVSVQERRAQTLASLTGPAHPLDGGEPACVRNLPMRSVSFRDPTPDKSRMEALSKLGLAQRRTQSVIRDTGTDKTAKTSSNANPADQPKPALRSAEITHSDFNSYGGKSITLNPTLTFRAEYVSTSVAKTEPSEAHSEVDGRQRVVASPQPNYRSRSHTFTPETSGFARKSDSDLSRRTSESRVTPPTPAPRPLRTSPRSPELRRKSLPKPSFRTQGITVQFSGRGATDEARRDALRKLGLLRDTT